MNADGGAAVGPAARGNADRDAGGMARSLFDVDAHYRTLAREAARPEVEFIEPVLDELFEFRTRRVAVVRIDRTHEGAL